jgi:hypothetical protein
VIRYIGGTVRGRGVLLGTLLLLGVAIPRPATAQASHEREVLNVLFVGNSQLFSNNLGDIVAGIAAADPLGPIIVPKMGLAGGLTEHLEGESRQLVEDGTEWDYVILQELALFPGNVEPEHVNIWPLPEREFVIGDVDVFHKATRTWVELNRAAGAKTIMFPSPPRQLARFDTDEVPVWKEIMDAHLMIARELDVDVAPIQEVFEETRQRLISVNMFMYDGSHPSAEGSYAEALVIYSMITGRDPAGAPALVYGRPISYRAVSDEMQRRVVNDDLQVPLVDLPIATAMELQRIAWHVVVNRERTGSN